MAERVILYVEDSPDDVHVMKASFERLKVNCTLQAVFGGREAIDRLKNSGAFTDRQRFPVPEIIFLDLKIPDIDGFEVLKMIKSEAKLRSIPVFAITGLKNPGLSEKATEFGAVGFIRKGWGMASFYETLDYMNTQLMAALKYDLLLQYHHPDHGMPQLPPPE